MCRSPGARFAKGVVPRYVARMPRPFRACHPNSPVVPQLASSPQLELENPAHVCYVVTSSRPFFARQFGKTDFSKHWAICVYRLFRFSFAAAAFLIAIAAIVRAPAGPTLSALSGIAPELIGPLVGPIIAEAIPR